MNIALVCSVAVLCFAVSGLHAAVLQVGPGKTYARIENAYANANTGDTVDVYPQAGNIPYQMVAVYIAKKRITFRGQAQAGAYVALSGQGYDYSGSGSVPRAMFQFNPGADSCIVDGFEISECHNTSYNGAAFRINQANGTVIRNCHFRNNDMGIMSNGAVSQGTAADQLIENCVVHDNGNMQNPGYNHNFYLGGTSAVIRGCNIYNATTGHNVKSRAHITVIEGCYVHDSPNREFDLVDEAGNTDAAGSHALISGCVIVKNPAAAGNRNVIHFGQDGGNDHNGTLYIVHCTIVTPYVSPVVDLSAANAGAALYNTILVDLTGGASGQTIVNARSGANIANAAGRALWISSGFILPAGGVFTQIAVGSARQIPPFADTANRDFHLSGNVPEIVDAGMDTALLPLPAPFADRAIPVFSNPAGHGERLFIGPPDIGAYEYGIGEIFWNAHLQNSGFITVEFRRAERRCIIRWKNLQQFQGGICCKAFNGPGRLLGRIDNVPSAAAEYVWDMRGYPSGFYLLKIGPDGHEAVKKIMYMR